MPDKNKFDLSLDPEFEEYDPLEAFDPLAEDEDETEEAPYVLSRASESEETDSEDAETEAAKPPVDERSDYERTRDLLEGMAPRRKIFLGILSFCSEQQAVSAVNAYVEEFKKDDYSIYTAADLCKLLEQAGAIERITSGGETAEEASIEPKTVVVDGVSYLEPNEPEVTYWKTTEAGQAVLEEDKPLERMQDLMERDAQYAPIYTRILELCDSNGGATIAEINAVVDDDPLVQKPRLYGPHFVALLEECDALAWKDKTWCITDVGHAAVELIATQAVSSSAESAVADAESITQDKKEGQADG